MAAVKQAVVFRAYPTKEQQAMLRSWMGACRFVWNQFVAYNKDLYAARRRFAFHGELSAFLPEMKRIEGYEWLADVPAISLVDVARSYDLALRNALADHKTIRAGKKLGGKARGFPVFKRKREGEGRLYLSSQSITALEPTLDAPHKARETVTVSKLGDLRVRGGRWPNGRILSATMALKAGQWFLSIRFEGEAPWTGAAPEVGAVGGDLGLASFLTWDDGAEVRSIDPPRHLRKAEKKLKRQQRRASRCAKGSARRKRRVRVLGRIHRQVANRRSDFLHQTSHMLTAKAGVIGLEDLGVQAMQRNRRLAKSVGDAGMAELVRQIRYKADWRGRVFVRIDRWTRSTGVCPDCGTVHGRLDLSVRIWTCEGCGAVHDRDAAAARVIRLHAMELVGKGIAEPASVTRRKRGESGPLRRGRGLRRKSAQGTANVPSHEQPPNLVAAE
jgi:putative transposase